VALFFFAATGNCNRSDQGEGNLEGASSSHGSLRCQWNKTRNAFKISRPNVPLICLMSMIGLS
jgi:hypothetical protein